MKKFVLLVLSVSTFSAFAGPEIQNIDKGDLERVAKEFSVNFTHTAVAAPETEGNWGIEGGLIFGRTGSPQLADVVDDAGEDGSDFRSIYHAGLMLRGHFIYDIFAEMTYLPSRTISDVEVKAHSFNLGWNAGAFFGLPLDLAAGASMSGSRVAFDQRITSGGANVDSEISLNGDSRVFWVAASKKFFFITPYLKLGQARTDSDIKVKAAGGVSIFSFSRSQSENVSSSGSYMVAGANVEFFFMRLGFELSRIIGVNRASAKLSVDF